ncbi:MAG: hypothetical protein A2143_03835 [Gallionellales bacterium RBG_16_57_15]|nr:MAG: hypothetical protein A2143_03835 [Gallionellales bacterium RBG_16_57_15]
MKVPAGTVRVTLKAAMVEVSLSVHPGIGVVLVEVLVEGTQVVPTEKLAGSTVSVQLELEPE